jgi:hypothetical protein
MTRRRRIAAAIAIAAVACGGLGSAHVAMADTGDAPVDVRSTRDRYWACLAVDHVEIGTCVENPLPDMSEYPSVPEMVDQVLRDLTRA